LQQIVLRNWKRGRWNSFFAQKPRIKKLLTDLNDEALLSEESEYTREWRLRRNFANIQLRLLFGIKP